MFVGSLLIVQFPGIQYTLHKLKQGLRGHLIVARLLSEGLGELSITS